jgi:hypothetical protein
MKAAELFALAKPNLGTALLPHMPNRGRCPKQYSDEDCGRKPCQSYVSDRTRRFLVRALLARYKRAAVGFDASIPIIVKAETGG